MNEFLASLTTSSASKFSAFCVCRKFSPMYPPKYAGSSADSSYKGPLCQERSRWSELKPAETGLTTADRGRRLA